MIFAERMSAQEAEDRGLVSKISTPGKIREMACKKAAEFAENVAPSSVRLMKTLLHNGFATPERATADLAALVDQILLASENSQAAMGAAAKT